tara:strand:+ start:58 stop:417 length:360 start_codon:yes stop_codon:yes gene_type:complete
LGVVASCGGSDQAYYYEECSGGGGHKLVVYPNPSDSEINIALDEKSSGSGMNVLESNTLTNIQDVSLTLLDFSGNPVKEMAFEGPVQDIKMDVSSLSKGIYFLKIVGKELDETHTVVIE